MRTPGRIPRTFGLIVAIAATVGLAGCPESPVPVPTPSKKTRVTATATPKTAPLPTLTPGGVATATPAVGATPTPAVGATPTPAVGATPTPAVGATPTPVPGVTPTPTPAIGPPPSGAKLPISGTVYDDAGDKVTGATIKAVSLDTRVAFTGTATTTTDGIYTIADVPEGANIQVTATKPGFTSRLRVGAYTVGQNATTDFGAPTDGSGPGTGAFISKYLEIASVEPDPTAIAQGKLGFKLKLSAPLDTANQFRFLAGIRVWPANEVAAPKGDADTNDNEDLSKAADLGPTLPEPVIEGDTTSGTYVVDYVIKDQTPFLLPAAIKAGSVWNAEGTELSFSFAAPLQRGQRDEARYQIAIVRGNDSATIKDTDGDPFGTNRLGELGALPPFPSNILRNTFREDTPSVSDEDKNGTVTPLERWTSTHDSVRAFSLPEDETPAKLTAVRVVKDVDSNFRFELVFDKPMTAFNGLPDGASAASLDGDEDRDGDVDLADFIRNYTFMLGGAVGETKDLTMDGFKAADDLSVDPRSATTFGLDTNVLKREFAFDVAAVAFRRRLGEATAGQIVVDVDEADPKVVRLTLKGRANWLDPAVKEIKVRAAGVADPSGQRIGTTAANRDVVTAPL